MSEYVSLNAANSKIFWVTVHLEIVKSRIGWVTICVEHGSDMMLTVKVVFATKFVLGIVAVKVTNLDPTRVVSAVWNESFHGSVVPAAGGRI